MRGRRNNRRRTSEVRLEQDPHNRSSDGNRVEWTSLSVLPVAKMLYPVGDRSRVKPRAALRYYTFRSMRIVCLFFDMIWSGGYPAEWGSAQRLVLTWIFSDWQSGKVRDEDQAQDQVQIQEQDH